MQDLPGSVGIWKLTDQTKKHHNVTYLKLNNISQQRRKGFTRYTTKIMKIEYYLIYCRTSPISTSGRRW